MSCDRFLKTLSSNIIMRYIIVGGGTGGHIYPALAIADALKDDSIEAEIVYVGTGGQTERGIVQGRNRKYIYTYKVVRACGMPRPLLSSRLPLFFLYLVLGILQSFIILFKFKPDVVIGTGGYAMVPMIVAAWLMRVKTFIHEQNATPGLANRVLARAVTKIGVSWPETIQFFPEGKAVKVGYPVRTNLRRGELQDAKKKLGFKPGQKVIFGFGGSQGARTINRSMAAIIPELLPEDVGFILSTGKMDTPAYRSYTDTVSLLEKAGLPPEIPGRLIVRDYFDDIQTAYDAADLVIARSGAGTIMELAAMKLPAILIPKSGLPGNHQLHNAYQAEAARGALVLQERKEGDGLPETVDTGKLIHMIRGLFSADEELRRMGEQIHILWTRDALERIVKEIHSLRSVGMKRRTAPVHWYMLGLAEEMLRHAEKNSLLRNGEYERHMHSFYASPNWRVRNIAVKLSGICRDTSFIPLLVSMIADRTPAPLCERLLGGDYINVGFIRRNAVTSLGRIGIWSPEVQDALYQALTDSYWEVRAEAIKSLKALAPADHDLRTEICSRLGACAGDRSFEVVYEAVFALAELAVSDSILDFLRPLYYHPNRKVKIAVYRALARLHENKLLPDRDALLREQSNIFIPGEF